jgi:hypothetical protein
MGAMLRRCRVGDGEFVSGGETERTGWRSVVAFGRSETDGAEICAAKTENVKERPCRRLHSQTLGKC